MSWSTIVYADGSALIKVDDDAYVLDEDQRKALANALYTVPQLSNQSIITGPFDVSDASFTALPGQTTANIGGIYAATALNDPE